MVWTLGWSCPQRAPLALSGASRPLLVAPPTSDPQPDQISRGSLSILIPRLWLLSSLGLGLESLGKMQHFLSSTDQLGEVLVPPVGLNICCCLTHYPSTQHLKVTIYCLSFCGSGNVVKLGGSGSGSLMRLQ